ncbi:MAG: glycosyltransferase [Granulosicoccus sp.]
MIAIDSILQQSLANFELLIIGHQSTLATLREQVPRDPRIKCIARRSPGITSALNTGISQSHGSYIARMDDDDIAYPDRLQQQLNALQRRSGLHLCGARIRFVDKEGSPDGVAPGNRKYQRWLNQLTEPAELGLACYRECPLPHPTFMAHRSLWLELGGYKQLDAPEDYDLVLRAMLAGFKLCKPEPLLQDWRVHSKRLSCTDQRYRREAFTRLAAWAAVQPCSGLALNSGRAVWLCGSGRLARHWHDALIEHGVTVCGFVDVARPGTQRRKRELPVIGYEQLAQSRSTQLLITAVTQPHGRMQICHFLENQGWKNGIDYIVGG